MVFASPLFLCLFFPVVLAGNFLLRALPERVLRGRGSPADAARRKNRLCNAWLLLCSLVFYGWEEPKFLLLMAATAALDYGAGLLIGCARRREKRALARSALIVTLTANIGCLAFFKYAGFLAQSLLNLLTSLGHAPANTSPFDFLISLALPIGISFYTFQTLSYVIDVYRGKVAPQRNFLDFFTYVALFPQLIAGPIVRYTDVERDLTARRITVPEAAEGVCRFCVGLSKKAILANSAGALCEALKSYADIGSFTCLMAWTASLSYFFQIYFDFSGYSDMAIGMGQMLGFRFPENFRYPYEARSITDFWRRWHITLSSWFREYLYIPLGGNRRGLARQILNLLIVWSLTGLWHGAGWNFLLWGLYFFAFLLIEKLFLLRALERPGRLRALAAHAYALTVVFFGWVIFAGAPGEMSFAAMLRALFGVGVPASSPMSFYYLRTALPLLLVCALASTHLPASFGKWLESKARNLRGIGKATAAPMASGTSYGKLGSPAHAPLAAGGGAPERAGSSADAGAGALSAASDPSAATVGDNALAEKEAYAAAADGCAPPASEVSAARGGRGESAAGAAAPEEGMAREPGAPSVARGVVCLALLVLSVAYLIGESYNPFLYTRF